MVSLMSPGVNLLLNMFLSDEQGFHATEHDRHPYAFKYVTCTHFAVLTWYFVSRVVAASLDVSQVLQPMITYLAIVPGAFCGYHVLKLWKLAALTVCTLVYQLPPLPLLVSIV